MEDLQNNFVGKCRESILDLTTQKSIAANHSLVDRLPTFITELRGITLEENHHGIINYKYTKTKCRHLKKFTGKGTARQVFIRVERLEINQSC